MRIPNSIAAARAVALRPCLRRDRRLGRSGGTASLAARKQARADAERRHRLQGDGGGTGGVRHRVQSVEFEEGGGYSAYLSDRVTKPIFQKICQIANVGIIASYRDAPIEDSWLDGIEKATQLRGLGLAGSKVTDAGLAFIARLKTLQLLNLSGCKVTDEGMSSLGRIPSRRWLDVHRCPEARPGRRLRASGGCSAMTRRFTSSTTGGSTRGDSGPSE